MESIKILHTADLHLGSPLTNMGDKAAKRKDELLETFSNIITLAKNEAVDAVVISGDMFETGQPDRHTVEYVKNEFEKLHGIPVFMVLGNHDYGLDAEFPANVHLFKNYIEKISIENVDFYGVSFDSEHCDRCIIEGLSADKNDNINILIVHGDLYDKSLYNPISAENIKYSNMDYIALGHVHSYFTEHVGASTVAYSGMPEGRGFDECGEMGVVIAEVGNGYAKCNFVPVCSRKYLAKSVDITGCEDNLDIAQKISLVLDGSENAYCVILKGEKTTFVDCDFVKNYLEKEYYYVEVNDLSAESSDDEYSLKNLFVKNCHNETALQYGLAALRGEKVTIE